MIKFINVLTICLLLSTVVFAQDAKRQQKMMSSIADNKWDKEAFLSDLETRFVPVADQVVKNLKVEKVTIDRKTGAISVTGKDGKGTTQTFDGTVLEDFTDGGANGANFSFLPDWLVCTWNWIWGYDCEEEAAQVEDWQQLETPEEQAARKRANLMME